MRRGGVVWWVGLAGACGRPQAPPIEPELARWRSFAWASVAAGPLQFDHAAILLPDTSGRSGGTWLQLDLAASGTMPRGYPVPGDHRAERRSPTRTSLDGLLSAYQTVRASLPGSAPPSALTQIGTYGLPGFEYSTLLLDFARQRLGILPPKAELPAALWPPERTTPIRYDGDRVVVPIRGLDGLAFDALLDTGLSPFPLWTTRDLWNEITDGPSRPVSVRYSLFQADGELVFVGARARPGLRIAATELGPIEVVYLDRGPNGAGFERWPFKVDAVLGPSAFRDRFLMALELRTSRMALLPSR